MNGIAMYCALHPEQESVAACAACGKGVCHICKVVFQGRVYCKGCLESGKAGPPPMGTGPFAFYSSVVCARLAAQGFTIAREELDGEEVLVGYREGLLVLNPTHSFVVLGARDTVTGPDAERYFMQCRELARRRDPGPRALHLLAVYAVLACNRIDPEAREFAAGKYMRGLASVVVPVVVDLSGREVVFFRSVPFVFGALYAAARPFILRTLVF